MKKLILAAAFAVSTFFAAQAQVGIALDVSNVTGGNYIGATGRYIAPMGDNLGLGASVGYLQGMGFGTGVSASIIPIMGEARMYFGGDQEEGGFFGEANLGLAMMKYSADIPFFGKVSTSTTAIGYGVGGGFKLSSGLDLGARWSSYDGGGLFQARIGMFF